MLEKLKNNKKKVLDNGFIRLIDYMGSDAAIVQAARVSYGAGTKTPSSDRQLIRYLMRHRHTSPFEMCEIKFHIRLPIDCMRQFIRHRTASVNEYSTRYSIAISEKQTTPASGWRSQGQTKQGSGLPIALDVGIDLTLEEAEVHKYLQEVYEQRLQKGVAREQARKDLPLSTYTEAYWKIDLHNLFNFLRQRLAPAAQKEIRDYATAIAEVVKEWVPLAYEAFEDYQLNAMYLSAQEIEILQAVIAGEPLPSERLSKGEQAEFNQKLKLLGL